MVTDVKQKGPAGWHSIYAGAVPGSVQIKNAGGFVDVVGQHDPAGATKFIKNNSGVFIPLDTYTPPPTISFEDYQVKPTASNGFAATLNAGVPSSNRFVYIIALFRTFSSHLLTGDITLTVDGASVPLHDSSEAMTGGDFGEWAMRWGIFIVPNPAGATISATVIGPVADQIKLLTVAAYPTASLVANQGVLGELNSLNDQMNSYPNPSVSGGEYDVFEIMITEARNNTNPGSLATTPPTVYGIPYTQESPHIQTIVNTRAVGPQPAGSPIASYDASIDFGFSSGPGGTLFYFVQAYIP